MDADHILRDSPILAFFQSLSGESGWEPHRLAGGFDRGGEFAVLALKFRGLARAPWGGTPHAERFECFSVVCVKFSKLVM